MANEALKQRVKRKLLAVIEDKVKDADPDPFVVVGSDSETGMLHVMPETEQSLASRRRIQEVPPIGFTKPAAGDRVRIKKGRSQPGFYITGYTYDGTNEKPYPPKLYTDYVVARDDTDLRLQSTDAGIVTLSALASQAPVDVGYWVNGADATLTAEQVVPASAAVLGSDGSSNPAAATPGEDYLDPAGMIYAVPPELTISAGGAVTATQSFHTIDTNGDAASDNLDTINWGGDGAGDSFVEIIVKANNDGRTVILKHLTGNIYNMTGADITLDDITKHARILFDIQAGGCYAWPIAPPAILKTTFNAKGDILSASADNTPGILSAGTDGHVLTLDSGEALGIKWAAGGGGASSLDDLSDVAITGLAQGDILAHTGANVVDINIAEQRVVGRLTGEDVKGLTQAELQTFANVEDGADVTDSTNVNAAGAVMEADYDANTILAANSDNTPAALTIAESRIVGRASGGNIDDLTAAQVKTILGIDPNDITFEGAIVYHDADQTISNTTVTNLAFNSEVVDTNSYHSTVTNNDRLTVPVAGYYLVTFAGRWENVAGGSRQMRVVINDTTIAARWLLKPLSTTDHFFATLVKLAQSDYVTLTVYQNTGGDCDVRSTSAYSPYFKISLLGV